MEKKSIFITGAASGIGRETAILFAERGWFVGLFDINETGVQELSRQIGENNCCYAKLDVSDCEKMQEAVAFFGEKTNQQMNVLFNNAGIMQMNRFENISLENHIKTIQVNIIGVVNGVYCALPLLKKAKDAHIVSMSSASAFYGVPELATYAASKFFVRGFTEALNLELEKEGIIVTDLMPLFVDTAMVKNQEHKSNSLEKFGAQLTPQQVAQIVWQATHKSKVHWVPTLQLKILSYFGNCFPFMGKTMMKWFN